MRKFRPMVYLCLIGFGISTAGCDIGLKVLERILVKLQEETQESDLEYHQRRLQEVDGPGWTDLHRAAARGDVAAVQKLLGQGVPVDVREEKGGTPLYEAARRGKLEVMKLLLKNGAKVDTEQVNQCTPLCIAAEYKQPEAVRLLLKHGAEVNHRDVVGNTPLHQAAHQAWHGDSEIVRILIEEGKANMDLLSNSGCYPLYCAVSENNTPAALYLLSKGANANFEHPGGTPTLFYAASNQNIKIVQALLKHGADPNRVFKGVSTPLQQAVRDNNIQIVRLLLKHQADPNLLPGDSESPLYWSIMVHRNPTLVYALLKGGADPNASTTPEKLPLYIAVRRKNVELTRMLLNYGADPMLKVGNHAIQSYAVQEGGPEIIKMMTQARMKRIKERRKNQAA